MIRAAHSEIQRLQRLHRSVDLKIELLAERLHLTPAEETYMRYLKKRKLQLKDRMVWFESILREDEGLAAE